MNEPHPVCEERAYWQKRFDFAAWLFLIMGLYFIFASETATAPILAISVSLGFRILNTVCQIRHIQWHIKSNGGDNMHL